MNELAISDVNADVRKRASQRIEEHQVAGLELIAFNLDQALRVGLLVDTARQPLTEAELEDVTREAAAIKSVVGCIAAAPVRQVEEIQCRQHHVGGAVAPRGWHPSVGWRTHQAVLLQVAAHRVVVVLGRRNGGIE
jgi:hypothetical protein